MSNQRRRAITQQMHGEPVQFAESRIVELGDVARRSPWRASLDGPYAVIFGGARGSSEGELASSWWFGDPVWEGTVDGKPVVGAGAADPQRL